MKTTTEIILLIAMENLTKKIMLRVFLKTGIILHILKIQNIMFKRKSKKISIYCLTFLALFSCKKGIETLKSIEFKQNKVVDSELKEKEWFDYIDSIYTYSLKNKRGVDSISLYFMKSNTPNIMAKSKYIFWRNAKSVKNGDFNLFIRMNTSRFLVVSNERRNVVSNEIHIDSFKIKESKKVLLDLNNSKTLYDPCNQISKLEHKVINKNVVFKVQIFQSCFEEYLYEQLNYSIP